LSLIARCFALYIGIIFLAQAQVVYAFDEDPALAVQIATAETPGYIQEWVSTTPEHQVRIKRVYEIGPEKTIYISMVVSGFEIDGHRSTDLVGSFSIIDPNKKQIVNIADEYIHKHVMPGGKGGFVMLDPAIDFTFEKADPPGFYTFKAEVRDRVSNKEAVGTWQILFRSISKPDAVPSLR